MFLLTYRNDSCAACCPYHAVDRHHRNHRHHARRNLICCMAQRAPEPLVFPYNIEVPPGRRVPGMFPPTRRTDGCAACCPYHAVDRHHRNHRHHARRTLFCCMAERALEIRQHKLLPPESNSFISVLLLRLVILHYLRDKQFPFLSEDSELPPKSYSCS